MNFFSRFMWLWVFLFPIFGGLAGCGEDVGEEDVFAEEDLSIEQVEQSAVVNWTPLTCLNVKAILAKEPLNFAARAAWADKQCCNNNASCAGYIWWDLPGSGSLCDVAKARCFEPCVAPGGRRVGSNVYCGGNERMLPNMTCVESGTPDKCTLVDACTGAEGQNFYPEGCR